MYPDKSLSNTTSVTTLKQSTNRVTITFSKDQVVEGELKKYLDAIIDANQSIKVYEKEIAKLRNEIANVKRNLERFPDDFMFQLTKEELQSINLQKQYLQDLSTNLRSQIVTSSLNEWGGNRYLPYAFTEQGVAMLSGVIHSKKAIEMNIAIMRAFVEIRKWMMQKDEVKHQLNEIKSKLGLHDKQLNEIYEVIENILDKEAAKRKWDNRERIGFKK